VLQVLHHQDQRGRGFALGNRADGFACLGQAGAAATEGLGHGEGEQAVFMQPFEIGVGEGAALVEKLSAAGQFGAETLEQGVEVGDFHGAQGRWRG